jgi:CRISPR-associated endonuclease/helicase Cas3
VLDEAQTLPVPLLKPCLAALDELQRNYGASIVLCTATQPALRKQDEFPAGLDIPNDRELAPDPPALYAALKRVVVEQRPGPTDDGVVASGFAAQPQMMCIVNSRAHAYDLFQRIRALDGAVHLTTLMCPRHRRAVLDRVRQQLRDGEPVRLVATSLIEAGVDIDFPEVWRAMAGLDQIAQAAGRCNREGKLVTAEWWCSLPPTTSHRVRFRHSRKPRRGCCAATTSRYRSPQCVRTSKTFTGSREIRSWTRPKSRSSRFRSSLT